MKAPFPWFGGKAKAAAEVWRRFGRVRHYVEPFFGTGAVLLGRPAPIEGVEVVNDADGLLVNAWRALTADPAGVRSLCAWPVAELDLAARHAELRARRAEVTEALAADPRWYDLELGAWWIWGCSAWLGSGWGSSGARQMPLIREEGIHRRTNPDDYLQALAARLRRVRVLCGDWSRCVGSGVLNDHGSPVGVFLDPPYDDGAMSYAGGGAGIASDVRAWAVEATADPKLRIALCGLGEHDELGALGWAAHRWTAAGGYSTAVNDNRTRETIWFSPSCQPSAQLGLWSA